MKQGEIKIKNPTKEEIEKIMDDSSINGSFHSNKRSEMVERTHKPLAKFEPKPEYFRLPSGLLEIDQKYLSDDLKIPIRRIGTEEEAKFKVFDELGFLKGIEEQLNSCIKVNLPIGEFSYIDKISMYIFLLKISYGKIYNIKPTCEDCGIQSSSIIDLEKDFETKYVIDGYEYPHPIKIDSYGGDITARFRFPKIKEGGLIEGEEGTDIFKQMNVLLVDITGTDGDGNIISEDDYDDIIKHLNNEDRNKFRKFISDFGEFGSDLIYRKKICKNKKCDSYNTEIELPFPIDLILLSIMQKANAK